MRPRTAPGAAVALLAAAVLSLGGCSPRPEGPPPGVSAIVYQPRTDIPHDRIAIQIRNDGDVPLVLTSARLTTPVFAAEAVWPRDRATVPAGYALDLRVEIPEVVCDDAEPAGTVVIAYRLGDAAGTATLDAGDPFGLLGRLRDAGCLQEAVERVARIVPSALIPPDAPGAPALLVLSVEPTGAPGSVVLESLTSTTLIAPFDGVAGADAVRLEIEVTADGPREVRVPIVPNRCDPHALMEDKVGTRIPLLVTAPGATGAELILPSPDALRAEIYAFWRAFCGLG